MGMIKEFKEFAMRGNVVDMAVGIIIGGAFGKIVTSFVNDIIMPPIGMVLGGVDFKDLKIVLQKGVEEVKDSAGEVVTKGVAEVSINWGTTVNVILDFIIVAFVLFLVIKGMNSMKKKEEEAPAAPPAPSNEEVLLTEIRDLLKKD